VRHNTRQTTHTPHIDITTLEDITTLATVITPLGSEQLEVVNNQIRVRASQQDCLSGLQTLGVVNHAAMLAIANAGETASAQSMVATIKAKVAELEKINNKLLTCETDLAALMEKQKTNAADTFRNTRREADERIGKIITEMEKKIQEQQLKTYKATAVSAAIGAMASVTNYNVCYAAGSASTQCLGVIATSGIAMTDTILSLVQSPFGLFYNWAFAATAPISHQTLLSSSLGEGLVTGMSGMGDATAAAGNSLNLATSATLGCLVCCLTLTAAQTLWYKTHDPLQGPKEYSFSDITSFGARIGGSASILALPIVALMAPEIKEIQKARQRLQEANEGEIRNEIFEKYHDLLRDVTTTSRFTTKTTKVATTKDQFVDKWLKVSVEVLNQNAAILRITRDLEVAQNQLDVLRAAHTSHLTRREDEAIQVRQQTHRVGIEIAQKLTGLNPVEAAAAPAPAAIRHEVDQWTPGEGMRHRTPRRRSP
jgi:hypothetical protein